MRYILIINDHGRGEPDRSMYLFDTPKAAYGQQRSSRVVLGRTFAVCPPSETDTHDMRPDQCSLVVSKGLSVHPSNCLLVKVPAAYYGTVSAVFFFVVFMFFSSK